MRFWAFLVVLAGCDRLLRLDDITPPDAAVAAAWTAVSAGNSHTCAIRTDGSLWCWGSNERGQLALGPQLEIDMPERVGGAKWSAISAGFTHTCGLQDDGSLWCWGRAYEGEIGIGYLSGALSEPEPAQVDGTWRAVTAGGEHTCALREDGTLWCWGQNNSGQLGAGTLSLQQLSPVQVPAVTAPWQQVSAGYAHTCAITSDAALWCWGDGSQGELGDGMNESYVMPTRIGSEAWTKIAAGYSSTCGITNGHLRCWGRILGGSPSPILLDGVDADGWTDVATGSDAPFYPMMCGLRADGTQWCWGDNRRGLLPAASKFGDTVQMQPGQTFAAVAVGGQHACSVATDHTLWCIGGDGQGQLGDGYGSHRSPTQIAGTWTAVAASWLSTCALDGQGYASCAGDNTYGELGDGTVVDRQTFAPATGAPSASQLTFGANAVLELTAAGQLWSWGEGDYGALGDGTTNNLSTPQAVSSSPQTWRVVAANQHACGIDPSGALYCWGRNDNGELGTGSTVEPAQPVAVTMPITTWSVIATGSLHSCGVGGGVAYCWGRGDSGQLGNNAQLTYAATPQAVYGVGYVAMTCGNAHSCAIDVNAKAWCWGDGHIGQLGVGGFGTVLVPTAIPDTHWRELSAGYSHTCGIQSDGSLWCWGSNSTGQLGDGTLQSRDTPTRTGDPAETSWSHVSAGILHTCATRADQTLWCWGGNANGQLGDGTAWRSQAIQIP